MTAAKTSLSEIAGSVRFQHHPTLTACWIWTGYVSTKGLPIISVGGEQESARRVVFRHFRRDTPLPEGRLFTRCQLALCVNPAHATTDVPRRSKRVPA